jgi:hypothetical protein
MAKKKRKHAVKKKKANLLLRLQRPLAIMVVGIVLVSFALVAHASPTKHTAAPLKQVSAVAAPTPRQQSVVSKTTSSVPAPTSTPATSTPVTTTPKVVSHTTIPQSTKSEPVVTPSPSSSVSSLAPVTAPSSSEGSGTGGSSTTQSNPGPTTTTGYTSSNWSGYMATTGNFTAISGTWTVPSVTGPSGETSADSAWIGIGGVSTSDLIQVGTQDTVSPNGQASSSAFYEMLPESSITIPSIIVTAGDKMTASVTEISSGEWTITITDTTNSQTFTINTAYTSSNSSAEWIEEDPSYSSRRQVPFDDFDTITFSGGTTVSNSSTESIAGSSAEPVTMLNISGTPISTPSTLTGGSFIVTREE